MFVPTTRHRLIALGALLAIALGLRVHMAATTAYHFDEDHDHIATAETISLRPPHLPVRVAQHSALTAYFIKAGSWIAGKNPVGYRLFGIVAGMLTIVGVMRLAEEWSGPLAGFVAGALLAFNEYHISVSALAVEKVYYLAFTVLFLLALTRLVADGRTKYAFLAAVSLAFAFLHKELAAVLIPIAGLTLVLTGRLRLLLRWEPYAALAVLLLIISPDVVAQLELRTSLEAGYGTHLNRVEGLGLSYQPLIFFGRSAVRAVFEFLGRPFLDLSPDYPSMNPLMGLVLITGSVVSLLRRDVLRDARRVVFLCVFWVILGFFLFVKSRSPQPGIDPVAWFWVDITLLPAVILVGHVLATRGGLTTRALTVGVILACTTGLGSVLADRLGRPSVVMSVCPEQIAVADSSYVPVTAVFEFCHLCRDRSSEAVLTGMRMLRDGAWEPVSDSSLVRGAEVGQADREFEVLAALSAGERDRWYFFSYDVPGRKAGQVEQPEAGVGVETGWAFHVAFWGCPSPDDE